MRLILTLAFALSATIAHAQVLRPIGIPILPEREAFDLRPER